MKFVFHIGAGKTGTTSIQRTLSENDAMLKDRGVWYLGLMLERTDYKKYEWQKPSSVVPEFHRLSNEEATVQLSDVLRHLVEEAREQGIHTLIWSNESFLEGKHNFLPVLQQLQGEGIDIQLLVYVRDYASWTRSAYVQWGIKHKTYPGKLLPFSEWSQYHLPSFYKQMENLLNKVPESVHVRNMNATDDVVVDFLKFVGVDSEGIRIIRGNDSPKNEELLLRAMFNSNYNEQVLPVRFENIIGRNIHFRETPEEYLASLLPKRKDLENVLQQTSEDRNFLNELLVRQGQPPLENKEVTLKPNDVNSDKLLLALVDIVMKQSRRIDRLESQLNEMKSDK